MVTADRQCEERRRSEAPLPAVVALILVLAFTGIALDGAATIER
jgi:hypothetical protein